MARTTLTQQHQQFRDFVFEVIWQAMPAAASIGKSDSRLVGLAFEMARKDRVFLRTPLIEIRTKYGLACSELFKILFIMYQRGGFSLETGEGFKSMWLYNMDEDLNAALFEALRNIPIQEQTAAKIVKHMKARGFQPIERVKIFEEGKVKSFFANGKTLEDLKKRKQEQNESYRNRRIRQREYAIKKAAQSLMPT